MDGDFNRCGGERLPAFTADTQTLKKGLRHEQTKEPPGILPESRVCPGSGGFSFFSRCDKIKLISYRLKGGDSNGSERNAASDDGKAGHKGVPDPADRGPEGGFVASIPELPGCLTFGETREEALARMEDAKRCWLAAVREANALADRGQADRGKMGSKRK